MVKFNGLWCHNSFCNWKFYKGIVLQSFILMKAQLTLSGPAFSVVRQAWGGGLRGPDAKNQG